MTISDLNLLIIIKNNILNITLYSFVLKISQKVNEIYYLSKYRCYI